MTHNEQHPTSRAAVLALLVVLAGLSGYYAYTTLLPTAATSSPINGSPGGMPRDRNATGIAGTDTGVPDDGGRIHGRVTVFDDSVSAVANLDTGLLAALREAATDAADDGVEIQLNSGWRSTEYQEQLLQQAVSKYGSKDAASRWVATPKTSPHVSGDAVDVGNTEATTWLSRHGAAYGLCQIYDNEPWHFELRDTTDGCPFPYADPTHDPRMN